MGLHGLPPVWAATRFKAGGAVAQLVEHRTENPGVGGSNPSRTTSLGREVRKLRASFFSLDATAGLKTWPGSKQLFLQAKSPGIFQCQQLPFHLQAIVEAMQLS